MAVQNHLLSNTILIRPDDNDDSDSSLQGETMKVQVNIPFKYPYLCPRGVCLPVCRWESNPQNGAMGHGYSFVLIAILSISVYSAILTKDVLFLNIAYHGCW